MCGLGLLKWDISAAPMRHRRGKGMNFLPDFAILKANLALDEVKRQISMGIGEKQPIGSFI